jgi:hypothetical protein
MHTMFVYPAAEETKIIVWGIQAPLARNAIYPLPQRSVTYANYPGQTTPRALVSKGNGTA